MIRPFLDIWFEEETGSKVPGFSWCMQGQNTVVHFQTKEVAEAFRDLVKKQLEKQSHVS